MNWIVGALAAAVLYEIIKEWGWKRGYRRVDESIDEVPETPGVYVLHFPGLNAVYVGSSKHLRTRLKQHQRTKPGWRTFDWTTTATEREARNLERRLQREIKRRRGK